MRTLLLLWLLASLVSASSFAKPTDKSVYSKPASSLRLVERSDGGDRGHFARFRGVVVLTGKLIVEFDRPSLEGKNPEYHDGEGQAFFQPDAASRTKLPAAIGTFYPRPVQTIWLDRKPSSLLPRVVGDELTKQILKGRMARYEFAAELTIRAFAAWIECDHRSYTAEVQSIRARRPEVVALTQASLIGC